MYIDDIILTGDYEEELLRLKKLLTKEFEIKDLRYLGYFMGMEWVDKKMYICLPMEICLRFTKGDRFAWM